MEGMGEDPMYPLEMDFLKPSRSDPETAHRLTIIQKMFLLQGLCVGSSTLVASNTPF